MKLLLSKTVIIFVPPPQSSSLPGPLPGQDASVFLRMRKIIYINIRREIIYINKNIIFLD